ncbi:MAG TPA: ELWxxDGT repeat protein [Tepidisphaeraceae bacterium]|nr:ELWxxDGT repeat protein [Tepidisphaeraceae bacterium]
MSPFRRARTRARSRARSAPSFRLATAAAAVVETLEPRKLLSVAMVKDLAGGSAGSNPTNITPVGDLACFVATDAAHGTELWRSDGTAAGTSIVADIDPGAGSSMPAQLTAVGDALFFVATDAAGGREVWKVDPATGTASPLKDIVPGAAGSNPSNLLAADDDTLYFAADTADDGRCLFRSDGTAAGTVAILAPSSHVLYPRELTSVNGMLFFVGDDELSGGTNLYRYGDGDAAPVALIDVSVSPDHTLTASGDLLYYIWQHPDPVTGEVMLNKCIYKSDGTAEGTSEVYIGDESADDELYIRGASNAGRLFFQYQGYLQTLDRPSWEARAIEEVYAFGSMAAVGDRTYYAGVFVDDPMPPAGQGLYMIDAAAQSAALVRVFSPGWASGGHNVQAMTDVDGALYFSAVDATGGRELWRSDGTPAGTAQVADVNPGAGNADPRAMTAAAGGKVFFSADDGAHGRELWVVNPPAAPGDLRGTVAGPTSLTLNWTDHASDESGYEIQRSSDGGVHFQPVATVAAGTTTLNVTALTAGTDYIFRARATGDLPSAWAFLWAPSLPTAPTGLTATAAADAATVTLTWASSGGVDGYYVYGSGDGGATFALWADVPAGEALGAPVSWTNAYLPEGARHHFKVRAHAGDVESQATPAVSTTTFLAAPVQATATLVGQAGLTLHWEDRTHDETGYLVLRRDPGGAETSYTTAAEATSLAITGLTAATAHAFEVRAVTAAQQSAPLALSVTTLAVGVPIAPSDLAVQAVAGDGHALRLTWTDNASGAGNETGYTIWRRAAAAGGGGGAADPWEAVATLDPDTTEYADDGSDGGAAAGDDLWSQTEYEYKVEADGPGGSTTSDPALGLTDRGDGLVFSGLRRQPDPDTDTSDGVGSQWSDIQTADLQNQSVTLTLSNLPEHYALQLALSAVLFDFSEGTGRPRPKVTISTGGSEREIYSTTWPALAPFEHTGDSVAITLTGANFSTAESERWMLEHLSVRVLRYRVGLGAPLLTIGEHEQIQVSVSKADGSPAPGVAIAVERVEKLEAQGGVTTGSDGTALVPAKGLELGEGSLLAKAMSGGGKIRQHVRIGAHRMAIAPSAITLVRGSEVPTSVTVSVRKADGVTPARGVTATTAYVAGSPPIRSGKTNIWGEATMTFDAARYSRFRWNDLVELITLEEDSQAFVRLPVHLVVPVIRFRPVAGFKVTNTKPVTIWGTIEDGSGNPIADDQIAKLKLVAHSRARTGAGTLTSTLVAPDVLHEDTHDFGVKIIGQIGALRGLAVHEVWVTSPLDSQVTSDRALVELEP